MRSAWIQRPSCSWSVSWSAMPRGTCFDPANIMCSKRCANPVRPASSFTAPTWYQMLSATSGRR